ncbi:hypothetical protein MK535_06845 [Streptococcus anginosus]|uniref:hypothetical protein n=1 Tax=Streptococcus anginosus TaxID=1328 RepID=UPI002283EA10|nr:hypothetical protein [Streptococcus anginosus]MCY7209670.1 hypothetical protein [Streptococcus anginosus]MCY7226704.1 hypothetical protein [Streptococcus anginosus]MCY7233079.1 hypothetical protein [Streptococcus anginosus]MEE0847678.1 hypothetical protein [Streptococcus anginosus]
MAAGFMRAYEEARKQLPFIMGQENMLAGRSWVSLPLTTNPISWVRKVSSRFYLKRKKPLCSNQSLSSDKRLVIFQISLLI